MAAQNDHTESMMEDLQERLKQAELGLKAVKLNTQLIKDDSLNTKDKVLQARRQLETEKAPHAHHLDRHC